MQREEIAETRLAEFREAIRQFRAILDIEAMAVSCHQLGQLIPCIHHPQHPPWILSRLNPTFSHLMADIPARLDEAHVNQLMQIYWGTSRLTAHSKITDEGTVALMQQVEQRLMYANEFWGNNACNMIEALSNFRGAAVEQATLDRVLLDAIYDFKAPCTSPFNISYFLQTIAKRQFKVKTEVIAAAVQNLTFHFDHLNMHHIAHLIASLAKLDFHDLHEFLHLFRQKLSLGSWSSQSMWGEDLVVLSKGLSQLDHVIVSPIMTKLEILARERHPPLTPNQARAFTQICQSMDYVLEIPITASNAQQDIPPTSASHTYLSFVHSDRLEGDFSQA